MMKKFQRYTFITAIFWLSGCSSVTVTTDYDHSVSFDHYRTYSMAPATEKIGLSPSSERAFNETLRASLSKLNISEASENADLHVVRYVSAKDKVAVYQSGYRGIPYGYGRYRMWTSAPVYTDVHQYTEGTLIVDFVDTKTQKLVFRGVATGTLGDPETNAKKIKEAVEKIVGDFPNTVR